MKTTEKKDKIKLALVVLILCSMIFVLFNGTKKIEALRGKKELTIGVFSDSYWNVQNGYSYKIVDDAIHLFEREHPDYKVTYVSGVVKDEYAEWLSEQLIKGKEPDLFFILGNEFNTLSETGALKNLNTLIASDPEFDSNKFYKSALDYGEKKGVQYALPYECAPRLMFVNQSILKAEGISLPPENWSWNDFYSICKQVTKDLDGNGTIDQFGVVGYSWEDAFYTDDIQVFNEEGTECKLQGRKVSDAISLLESLDKLNGSQIVTEKDFDLGKVAFMPMLFSEYRAYKSYPLSVKKYSGFEWDCTTMPAGVDGDNVSLLDTLMIGMSNRTVHEKEAWDFMKILTTNKQIQSELYVYSEGISPQKDTTEYAPVVRNIIQRVMEQAVVVPRFSGYDEAVQAVEESVNSILSGKKNKDTELILQNRKINKELQTK